MADCLFCKIVTGEMESDIVYRDNEILAFKDIDPKAPHHILIIPRKHIATLSHAKESDTLLLGNLLQVAKNIAADLDVAEAGYRVVINCNEQGGQAVYHIHVHLLAGRQMGWPPG